MDESNPDQDLQLQTSITDLGANVVIKPFLDNDYPTVGCSMPQSNSKGLTLGTLSLMLHAVYSVVLHKGKPLYSATSHRVKNQQKKTEGVRFNPLTVQMFYGERKT